MPACQCQKDTEHHVGISGLAAGTNRFPARRAPLPGRTGTAGSSSASPRARGSANDAPNTAPTAPPPTPVNRVRKGSIWNSTASTPSGRLARPISPASGAEGWVCLRDKYDDGGFSGGTLERPALKDLIADIEDGLVDIVVVYKIDRLSRALMGFSKLVEIFDKHGVTFVSVTQPFNTTTSMGRLALNILLSFAQFEREVIGERIRDKVAASRKKGIWMGAPELHDAGRAQFDGHPRLALSVALELDPKDDFTKAP